MMSTRNGNASSTSTVRMISVSTLAPIEAGERAQGHADEQRAGRRHEAQQQVDLPGVDDPREHVPAQVVGPEQVPDRGWLEAVLDVLLQRIG